MYRRQHHGGVAPVVARCRVVLLIARLMLFVYYHKTQTPERQKYSRPSSYYDTRFVAFKHASPDVDSFVVTEFGVIYDHPLAEHALQSPRKLCRKGYLRHKKQCLTPFAQHKVD